MNRLMILYVNKNKILLKTPYFLHKNKIPLKTLRIFEQFHSLTNWLKKKKKKKTGNCKKFPLKPSKYSDGVLFGLAL